MEQIRISRRRRQRKSHKLHVIIAVTVGLALFWFFGWELLFPSKMATKSSTVNLEAPAKKKKRASTAVAQRTFVIFGAEEKEGQKRGLGAIEAVYDPARNRLAGMNIEPNTYVLVPGRGLLSLAEGYAEGPANLMSAIEELSGIKAEGYIVVGREVYEALVESKSLSGVFNDYSVGSFSKKAAESLRTKVGNIPKERATLVTVPTKSIIIGAQTYYELDKNDVTRLVRSIWGRLPAPGESPIKVIILNGNGTPGVARTAADRLIGNGYKVLDVKNADNFNYPKTEILLYSKRAKKSGKAIAKTLKTGAVVEKSVVQDVTDVVIVIGKDFH